MKRFFPLLVTFILSLAAQASLTAQNLPLGGWNVHLPYRQCKFVTGNDLSVYASTTNGLFKYNKIDNTVERITKIEGLSDHSINSLGYTSYLNTVFVGYQSGNIDIIRGKEIINLPDIKRSQIIGDKSVNNVYFINNLAYVSCGFGIVVIDLDALEVRDTYLLGINGTNMAIYDIIADGTTIYAAAANGVYYAPQNSQFLANYTTWTKYAGLPNGPYSELDLFGGRLLANFSKFIFNGNTISDTLFTYDFNAQTWSILPGWGGGLVTKGIYVKGPTLFLANAFGVITYDQSFSLQDIHYNYFDALNTGLFCNQIFVDNQDGLWIADENSGLARKTVSNSFSPAPLIYPTGPKSINAYSMSIIDGHLLMTPGGKDDAWNNIYNVFGVSSYENQYWNVYDNRISNAWDTLFDLISVAIDPDNKEHAFIGSWGRGLIEVNGSTINSIYNTTNSSLRSKVEYPWVGVGGLDYDKDGNLWVTNSHTLTPLHVRKKDNTWIPYDFTGYIPIGTTVSQVIATEAGQKWIILPRGGGMLVFDDKGTLATFNDDKKKKLGFTAGTGHISGAEAVCMAEDRDGEIWVGTDKGICVFYTPENVFNSSGFDAQQILIEQDGNTQILLESQVVTAIAVDGANRKWIGTEGGGVFLMSPDGTKQIAHFDSKNSPMLDDGVSSIVIDEKSGEVFIGTGKGLVSYRGDAVEGGDKNENVYAYPNPVRPEYRGPIAIRGLVKDADVRITDITGQLIYKTTALGGQAVWDGNNFQGQRAASGVYLVFITNDDGTETAITKILLIN
jgi:hypothetical protein